MTQQNTIYIPDHHGWNTDDRLRMSKAIIAPQSYGAELGFDWTMAVSASVLEKAAEYMTVEEQLHFHFEYYDDCVRAGIPCGDNTDVIAIYCKDECPIEIVEFFSWAKDNHPIFMGKAFAEDPGVSYHHDDGDIYFVHDVPNFAFRMFEKGWAMAVREVCAAMCKNLET